MGKSQHLTMVESSKMNEGSRICRIVTPVWVLSPTLRDKHEATPSLPISELYSVLDGDRNNSSQVFICRIGSSHYFSHGSSNALHFFSFHENYLPSL